MQGLLLGTCIWNMCAFCQWSPVAWICFWALATVLQYRTSYHWRKPCISYNFLTSSCHKILLKRPSSISQKAPKLRTKERHQQLLTYPSAPHIYDAQTSRCTWRLLPTLTHQIRFEDLLAIKSAAEHLGAKLEIQVVTQSCPCATHCPCSPWKKVYLSKIALQAITPWAGVMGVCGDGGGSPTKRRFN